MSEEKLKVFAIYNVTKQEVYCYCNTYNEALDSIKDLLVTHNRAENTITGICDRTYKIIEMKEV